MNTPYYQDDLVTLYHGNCLEITEWLAAVVVHKRRGKGQPGDQYVTMTLRDLIVLLGGEAA